MLGDVHILQTLTIHTSDVNSVDFAGDCVLVTASGDKRIRVWEWRQGLGYAEACFSPLMGHKYGVTSVKVSPQCSILASSSIDGTTVLWNLRTGAKIHTLVQVGGESVRVCRFAPDSTLLATAGDNGQVCIWDLIRRNLIRAFQKHDGAVQSVCFTPDSNWLVTTCTFGVLKLYSTADLTDTCLSDTPAYVSLDDAHDLGVVSCDFSTHQQIIGNEPFTKTYQLITCGNDHFVKLWEIVVTQDKCETQPMSTTINLCRTMEKHSSALTCVKFNYNGSYIASCSLDKTTVIWETDTGKIASVINGHGRYVACCAFSKDGNLLATGSNDKSVIVWDLKGHLNLESEIVKHYAPKFCNSMDSQQSIQESDVVLNAETSTNEVQLIQRLDDHGGAINSVAFGAHHQIASASGDKLVRIWSVDQLQDDEEGEILKFNEESYSPFDGHSYSVNYVEFSPCGSMLASCSLDGTTIIWDAEHGGQAKTSFINSGLAIRICRWSPDGTKIATAGDDEKTTLWDMDTMEELQICEGHGDAVTSIAFTPDSHFLVATCSDGSWRLFDILEEKGDSTLLICDEGHDLGVQGCDFNPSYMSSAIRKDTPADRKNYLLATCGNDSFVKLWHISILKNDEPPTDEDNVEERIFFKQKKSLAGHGGNVMNVRFAPLHGEIVGSVATDRTARIWSVHSGICLHVLEDHDSLVTACTFSTDTSLFITGALDKTVLIWKLPQQLISESILIDNLRHHVNRMIDWKVEDTLKWLSEIGLSDFLENARNCGLTGRQLKSSPEDRLMDKLGIDDEEQVEIFRRQLYWLRRQDGNVVEISDDSEILHEFLCPITHEIMKEPVQCSDGFTYEKAAINEWFLCGKYTSPMTNEPLHDTTVVANIELRNTINGFLYGEPE